MLVAIGYVGHGEYRAFIDEQVVGVIRKLNDKFCPIAYTRHGEKLCGPVDTLEAAKKYIQHKIEKHGRASC